MDKANQITSSEMSKETVDFLKIQRALIEFAQQVGAERIGVEVHDKDSSARDTSMNGAMTSVRRPQERWAGAWVPVRSKRPWTTAYGLVFSIRGCLIGGECLPVGVFKKVI